MDTTTYDPDETRTQPLTQTEIESIIDRPMPEINPIHVRPSDMPWSKADKAEVIASIIRYDRTEAAWASVDAETARSYVSRHMAESDSDVARLAVKSVKSSYAMLDDREKARVRDEYVTKMDGLKPAIEDSDPEELEDVSEYGDKVEELHLEINEIGTKPSTTGTPSTNSMRSVSNRSSYNVDRDHSR